MDSGVKTKKGGSAEPARKGSEHGASSIRSVAIIGAGQMGNGIAHVVALAGYDVMINDQKREAVDKAKLMQLVRIPGHCSDMPAAFMVADVIVAPSVEPEAFGRVAVEAQAMGKPLVASKLGAQTETVLDGVTGFLFEPGNAEALASAISRSLKLTDAQRSAMAAAARERVLKNYTVDVMCERTLAIYRKLLSAGG